MATPRHRSSRVAMSHIARIRVESVLSNNATIAHRAPCGDKVRCTNCFVCVNGV